MAVADDGPRPGETAELRRLRRRIDALDRKLVALLNERATLAREAGRAKSEAGWTAIRDKDREREVLLRVSIANEGPMPQADLLALYRRLFAATRTLEARDRERDQERARARGGRGRGGLAHDDRARNDRAREDRGDEPT
jgi:chorismate mutase